MEQDHVLPARIDDPASWFLAIQSWPVAYAPVRWIRSTVVSSNPKTKNHRCKSNFYILHASTPCEKVHNVLNCEQQLEKTFHQEL